MSKEAATSTEVGFTIVTNVLNRRCSTRNGDRLTEGSWHVVILISDLRNLDADKLRPASSRSFIVRNSCYPEDRHPGIVTR